MQLEQSEFAELSPLFLSLFCIFCGFTYCMWQFMICTNGANYQLICPINRVFFSWKTSGTWINHSIKDFFFFFPQDWLKMPKFVSCFISYLMNASGYERQLLTDHQVIFLSPWRSLGREVAEKTSPIPFTSQPPAQSTKLKWIHPG